MTYVALARRYRPRRFAEVEAQEHVTETLQRALASGRVAPAYLFTGPRGSGKTTVARLLAKAVNCAALDSGEPCATCESCVAIAEGRSLDVLEIDGASNNSVEDVRELRENVRYAASEPGRRKVYIIDEVHMLSQGAFNALLKTLEEPPPHVLFVFATTEVRKVPATILSRCQRFDFRRLHTEEILGRLEAICTAEKVTAERAALFMLAKRADGSLRDGLSLLDQVISHTGDQLDESRVAAVLGLVREEAFLDLLEAIQSHDAVRALQLLATALHEGADPPSIALGLVEHLRNLMLLGVDATLSERVALGDAHLERARALAAGFRTEDLLHLLDRAVRLHEDVRRLSHPVILLEAGLVELAHYESRVLLREVLDRLGEDGDPPPTPRRASGNPSATPASGGSRARGAAPRRRAPRGGGAASTQDTGSAGGAALAVGGPPTMPAPPVEPGQPEPSLDERFAPGPLREAAQLPPPNLEGPLDLQTIRDHWETFTQRLRASHAMLAHCLSEGTPAHLEDERLELSFAAEQAFHTNLLQDNRRRRELETQLRGFFGQSLKVRVRAGETPAAAPAAAPVRLTPEDVARSRREAAADIIEQTPHMQEILEVFDGEILDDRS